MRSTACPVASARMSSTMARWRSTSRAVRSRSVACPWKPPLHGWWIRMRALAVARRRPLVPPASSTDAIEAARPEQVVATGQARLAMVSKIASPARTSPPGEFTRRSTGWSGSSCSRNSRRAMTSLASSVVTGPDSMTTRRRRRRSTGSIGRSAMSLKCPMLMGARYPTSSRSHDCFRQERSGRGCRLPGPCVRHTPRRYNAMTRFHELEGFVIVAGWGVLFLWGFGLFLFRRDAGRLYWALVALLQILLGFHVLTRSLQRPPYHFFFTWGALVVFGLTARALMTGLGVAS